MLTDRVIIYPRTVIGDSRGYFLKVITGNEDGISDNPVGEIYLTCGNPGQSKGSHYHVAAKEWFTCIQGRALLKLEDTNSHEILTIELDSSSPKTVFIPQLVAHSLDCIGQEPFIVLAYTDKQYDKNDTIPYIISK